MWRNITMLVCPKNTNYTIEKANLGWMDNCFTCENKSICRKNVMEQREAEE